MKILLKKVKYIVWAILYALGHWSLTQTIFWGVANMNVLVASVLNAGYIVAFIFLEKIEIYIYKKIKVKNTGRKPGVLLRMYSSYMTGASLKTALYLFYFVILVFATINDSSPGVFYDEFGYYLQSVQYGILLLLAADTFVGQLYKDIANDEAGEEETNKNT
ncbi:MAG: hypothetical protein FWC92_00315 [Defluviitaleaceae bacterium]|nr:hypothetical protein [Defluviitaleaceae bacterium]